MNLFSSITLSHSSQILATAICCIALILASATLPGCGSSAEVDEYETYFEEVIAKAEALTAEFESIQDRKSAAIAGDNIVRLSNELSALFAKASELPEVGSLDGLALKSRVEEEWEDKFKTTFEKLEEAANAAKARAGNHPAMRRVAVRMENLQKEIDGFRKAYEELDK